MDARHQSLLFFASLLVVARVAVNASETGGASSCKCVNGDELSQRCSMESEEMWSAYEECGREAGLEQSSLWRRLQEDHVVPEDNCVSKEDVQAWQDMDVQKCWSNCVLKKLQVVNELGLVAPELMVSAMQKRAKESGLPLHDKEGMAKCIQDSAKMQGGGDNQTSRCLGASRAGNCVWVFGFQKAEVSCWRKGCQQQEARSRRSNVGTEEKEDWMPSEDVEGTGDPHIGRKEDCGSATAPPEEEETETLSGGRGGRGRGGKGRGSRGRGGRGGRKGSGRKGPQSTSAPASS